MKGVKEKFVRSGVPGLDAILMGGLRRGRTYLVQGRPGTGKTTFGMQFLLEGLNAGERVMLVSFIETREELLEMAQSHGWSLEKVHVPEIFQDAIDTATTVQTVFPSSEIEFGEVADKVVEQIEKYRPDRLLLDSVSQLSMLSDSWYQLRGPILRLRDRIYDMGCTTLFTSSHASEQTGELETIVHGSISLKTAVPSYGQVRRELIVNKMRGSKFFTGFHNYRIRTGGIDIFNWPETPHDSITSRWEILRSGVKELDELLGGGLEEGTACLFTGGTGAGKSTLASLYVQAAARRGQHSVVFCFDERKDTFLRRSASLGLEISEFIERGLIDLRQVNTGEMSPGEFAQVVREAVENNRARVVLIDSLSGYLNAMPGEALLMTQLHELLSYLSGIGVLTIMVVTKFDSYDNIRMELDASYIADTIVLLRHFEAFGKMRRCIAVVKKRHGNHEKTIREFKIAPGGCQVGPPLTRFTGILSGTPAYVGDSERLLEKHSEFEKQ